MSAQPNLSSRSSALARPSPAFDPLCEQVITAIAGFGVWITPHKQVVPYPLCSACCARMRAAGEGERVQLTEQIELVLIVHSGRRLEG